jgi:hypothetical protein
MEPPRNARLDAVEPTSDHFHGCTGSRRRRDYSGCNAYDYSVILLVIPPPTSKRPLVDLVAAVVAVMVMMVVV